MQHGCEAGAKQRLGRVGGRLVSVLQENQESGAFNLTACNADSGLDENLCELLPQYFTNKCMGH